jgi:hypothetical protein
MIRSDPLHPSSDMNRDPSQARRTMPTDEPNSVELPLPAD